MLISGRALQGPGFNLQQREMARWWWWVELGGGCVVRESLGKHSCILPGIHSESPWGKNDPFTLSPDNHFTSNHSLLDTQETVGGWLWWTNEQALLEMNWTGVARTKEDRPSSFLNSSNRSLQSHEVLDGRYCNVSRDHQTTVNTSRQGV